MSRFVRGGKRQGGAKEESTYTLTGLEVNLHVEEKSYVSLHSYHKRMVISIVHADYRVWSAAAIEEQWAREESFHSSDSGGERRQNKLTISRIFAD